MKKIRALINWTLIILLLITSCIVLPPNGAAQRASKTPDTKQPAKSQPAADEGLGDMNLPQSEMRGFIERFNADRGNLNRSISLPSSPARRDRLKKFYDEWLAMLARVDFDSISQDGKVDYILMKNYLDHELRQLDIQSKNAAEEAPLIPFAQAIVDLEAARRRMEPIDSQKIAIALTELAKRIDETRRGVELGLRAEGRDTRPVAGASDSGSAGTGGGRQVGGQTGGGNPAGAGGGQGRGQGGGGGQGTGQAGGQGGGGRPAGAPTGGAGAQTSTSPVPEFTTDTKVDPIKAKKTVAYRAANSVANLRSTLRSWYGFYNGYDPTFTWWVSEPYRLVDRLLETYVTTLSERVVGVRLGDDTAIVGDPIGREALMSELQYEMIPYTPEQLITIANKEYAWCEAEMKKASRELGYGDDWKKALEHVKDHHMEAGKQTELIKDLALEAIKFVDDNDLVTVPQLARDSWRMEMMSPERQLVSPFFLGGEVIQVSFPTNTMTQEQKMMSMRGNNIDFSRATVFHELIPGHHLQGFMSARYNTHRALFSTPFWTEGGALYWEFLFWNMNFPKTPENKIGMLFWRMHRCARIIFSLSFHLEKMTPQECIDFLVEKVGHERANATGEVRRSFGGGYGPLYQCAYMLGALELWSLRKEMVDSGKMTNRQYHDSILKANRIPIEMLRATLTRQKLTRDFVSNWKFYGDVEEAK